MTLTVDLLHDEPVSDFVVIERCKTIWMAEYDPSDAIVLICRVLGSMLPGTDGRPLKPLSARDQANVQQFIGTMMSADAVAQQYRMDMELLRRTVQYHDAMVRLAISPVSGDQQDADERAAAQAVVSAVTQDVLDLHALRYPAEVPDAQGS